VATGEVGRVDQVRKSVGGVSAPMKESHAARRTTAGQRISFKSTDKTEEQLVAANIELN